MNDKIFGYDWDDIKRAQQGDMSGLRRFRVSSAPGGDWTEAGQDMLNKFGSIEELEAVLRDEQGLQQPRTYWGWPIGTGAHVIALCVLAAVAVLGCWLTY